MIMKNLFLIALALLILPGCASSAASKVIKALGQDPATVSIRVNGWGTVIEVSRANPVIGMNSAVSTDGSLNVTSLTNFNPHAVPVVGRFTSDPVAGTFTPAPAVKSTSPPKPTVK